MSHNNPPARARVPKGANKSAGIPWSNLFVGYRARAKRGPGTKKGN